MALAQFMLVLCLVTVHVTCSGIINEANSPVSTDSSVTASQGAAGNGLWDRLVSMTFLGFKKKKAETLVTHSQYLNLDKAHVLAHLESISYCHDFEALKSWNCTRCHSVPLFKIFESIVDYDWDVHAYVGYYPPWKAKVIAFRGTDNTELANWLENVKTTQHHVRLDLPGVDDCSVHNGFSRTWNIPFRERVLHSYDGLVKKYGKKGPLYIVGHSSGGAYAQLAALTIKLVKEVKDVRLYTFGSPRVGNLAFAKKITSLMTESWRFTHMRDTVPTVPWKKMGFWHCGQEVFQKEQAISIGKAATLYHICDGTGEDPKCHDGMCPWWFGCDSVVDHLQYMRVQMQNDHIC